MFQLSDFFKLNTSLMNCETSSFTKLLKTKWDNIFREPEVFRYKINNLQERVIDRKYLMLLNPDRSTNRRPPECINDICQPFDDRKFNFTKVCPREILFSLIYNGDEHVLVVNVSPISHYHTLLCPSVNKKLPQIATQDSLSLALEIMFLAKDRDLKIGFNSMCAFATVNHLHYHLLLEKQTLPVELAKWKQIKHSLHCTEDYIIPAFCFEVKNDSIHKSAAEVYKLIRHLLHKRIAHNILITLRTVEAAAVYVFPRKGTAGVKQLKDFNVAAFELSGWIIMFSAESFHALQSEDLDTELKKWKLDDFDTLCREVELLSL